MCRKKENIIISSNIELLREGSGGTRGSIRKYAANTKIRPVKFPFGFYRFIVLYLKA